MDSASTSSHSGLLGDGGRGCSESLSVAFVDESVLTDAALRSRLKVLGRAESQLAAMRSRTLAELSRRHSVGDAQRMVRNEMRTSRRAAKREVETARELAQLPATSDALASGDMPEDHARLIARASSEGPIDEALLVEAANEQSFDEFARTVKRHQRDLAVDDGQSVLDRQRRNRKARIFESPESGMFVLSAEFDQITGARIATALTAKERQLWHHEDSKARPEPRQRMADALAELICEPGTDSNSGSGSGKSPGTDLLVIADFDVVQQQLGNPRLADGSPIPLAELHRMALDADILPSIFDVKSQKMWLGRKQRTASEAQRVALIARDQHCVGCGTNPLWCRAHHIVWWSQGGATDLDNLLLVCDDCHHKIHDLGWTVHRDPQTAEHKLKPPTKQRHRAATNGSGTRRRPMRATAGVGARRRVTGATDGSGERKRPVGATDGSGARNWPVGATGGSGERNRSMSGSAACGLVTDGSSTKTRVMDK